MIDFLNPIFLYSFFREKAYSLGVRTRLRLPIPVISVGNIQFGGSGKTPFVMYLLERYEKYQVAVVSQSYKASLNHPGKVDLTKNNFEKLYGDEPCLIKKNFPQIDVWCGPIKWRTAQAAAESKNYDFIILDDGFTHHQLFRDLDILLMDGSRSIDTYRLPPLGELRESFSSCRRADAVIVTKIAELSKVQPLVEMIKGFAQRLGRADYISQLKGEKGASFFLFAGIGHFDYFHQNAKDLGLNIHSFEKFGNHFDYTEKKQKLILDHLRKFNLRGLTTLKDKVKITNKDLLSLTDHLQVHVCVDKNMEQWLDESILAKISTRPW